MVKNKNMRNALIIAGMALLVGACSKNTSRTTGRKYNSAKWGGFANVKYRGQETGPGLVLCEGGAFKMGSVEKDLTYANDNVERKVTVHTFYMDETEVSNLHYREYLAWLGHVFGEEDPIHVKNQLPDTNCWRSKLGFNEPFVEYYFRHPAYKDYPVVGINWHQATGFAAWRTDRVNEAILDREGVIKYTYENEKGGDANFETRAYMAGQNTHLTKGKKGVRTYQSKKKKNNKKYVASLEDGILLPDYRIPTEAEWEYAAKGNVGETEFDNINQDKVYPWSDYTLRMKEGKEKDRGKFMLNVMRGKGDYMGVAGGQLNDGGEITTPVYSYWPNSFGVYNMGGNVSEWVNDIYRPLSIEDMDDFMPFRGNVFKVAQLDEYGEGFADKDSLGRLRYIDVTKDMNVNRRNYKVADNIGFKDELNYNSNEMMYEYGVTSLINNQARVYKGGSWADRAYWAAPGTRRYLDENLSMSTLGFRCCMTRVGSPAGNGKKRYNGLPSAGGNKKTRQKKKN